MKTDLVNTNSSQRLYVLTCGGGYSCLGFDVCQERSEKLAAELGITFMQHPIGTEAHYNYYLSLIEVAKQKHAASGWRSVSELNPALIGLEGKRIEATVYGERMRFKVGKSTGFIPVHIQLHNTKSGGSALPSSGITDIRIIRDQP